MNLRQQMDAYKNGEVAAVPGPLNYVQAMELVEMSQRLVESLKEMIQVHAMEASGTPLTVDKKRRMHYGACVVVVDAEKLL